MDWLTFVSSIIQSLAWPLTALTALLVFRRPLLRAASYLRSVKYKDAEFTFEQQVAELHEVAAVASPAEQQQLTAPSVPSDSLVRLAAASPRAAIIEAWAEVASAAVSALRRRGVALPADISRRHLAIEQALQQSEILSPNQVALLRDLRQTRNTAAHAPKFALSEASALEYVMLATRMKALLDSKR